MTDIGRAIREARKRKGLSQEELAELVSMTRTTVSNWERGEHEPTKGNLDDLAGALGLTTAELWAKADAPVRAVRESPVTGYSVSRTSPPPKVYQGLYDHCEALRAAGVDDRVVSEAWRILSGEALVSSERLHRKSEAAWLADVRRRWQFLVEEFRRDGYKL